MIGQQPVSVQSVEEALTRTLSIDRIPLDSGRSMGMRSNKGHGRQYTDHMPYVDPKQARMSGRIKRDWLAFIEFFGNEQGMDVSHAPGETQSAAQIRGDYDMTTQIEFKAEIERQRLKAAMRFYDYQAEMARKEHEEKFLRFLRSKPDDEFNNNQHDRPNKYRPLHPPLQITMESNAIN